MCIIAAKPAGVSMPDDATLRRMWNANPDGAGFMYPVTVSKNGKTAQRIRIEKGFMEFADFMAALDRVRLHVDLKRTPVVMHFRITTHGGTCPELTHPFPVSDSESTLRKTSLSCSVGIAHNGIISSVSPRKSLSDTGEYVATQLAPLYRAMPNFHLNPDALTLIKNAIRSKMAILTPDGRITTVGDFTEDGGILYSNTSYKERYFNYRFSDISTGGWTSYADSPWGPTGVERLMLLYDIPGAYVSLDDGMLLDTDYSCDYAIDSRGNVYEYDSTFDVFVPVEGARAYNAQNNSLTYHTKKATWENVMTEEELYALYEMLDDDPCAEANDDNLTPFPTR